MLEYATCYVDATHYSLSAKKAHTTKNIFLLYSIHSSQLMLLINLSKHIQPTLLNAYNMLFHVWKNARVIYGKQAMAPKDAFTFQMSFTPKMLPWTRVSYFLKYSPVWLYDTTAGFTAIYKFIIQMKEMNWM